MTLTGDVVLDIVQHFVERWNEVKKRKVCCILKPKNACLILRCAVQK